MAIIFLKSVLLLISLSQFTLSQNAHSIIGKASIIDEDSLSLIVKISLLSTNDEGQLGNCSMRLAFNDTCLTIPRGTNFYEFTFSADDEYYNPTVTIPARGVVSINIACKDSTGIMLTGNELDIVEINFDKTGICNEYLFKWLLLELFSPNSQHQWEVDSLILN